MPERAAERLSGGLRAWCSCVHSRGDRLAGFTRSMMPRYLGLHHVEGAPRIKSLYVDPHRDDLRLLPKRREPRADGLPSRQPSDEAITWPEERGLYVLDLSEGDGVARIFSNKSFAMAVIGLESAKVSRGEDGIHQLASNTSAFTRESTLDIGSEWAHIRMVASLSGLREDEARAILLNHNVPISITRALNFVEDVPWVSVSCLMDYARPSSLYGSLGPPASFRSGDFSLYGRNTAVVAPIVTHLRIKARSRVRRTAAWKSFLKHSSYGGFFCGHVGFIIGGTFFLEEVSLCASQSQHAILDPPTSGTPTGGPPGFTPFARARVPSAQRKVQGLWLFTPDHRVDLESQWPGDLGVGVRLPEPSVDAWDVLELEDIVDKGRGKFCDYLSEADPTWFFSHRGLYPKTLGTSDEEFRKLESVLDTSWRRWFRFPRVGTSKTHDDSFLDDIEEAGWRY